MKISWRSPMWKAIYGFDFMLNKCVYFRFLFRLCACYIHLIQLMQFINRKEVAADIILPTIIFWISIQCFCATFIKCSSMKWMVWVLNIDSDSKHSFISHHRHYYLSQCYLLSSWENCNACNFHFIVFFCI